MKPILIAALLLTTPFLAGAQIWYVGGKAGTTFSNYKTKTPWKEVPNMGLTFGATAFNQLNDKLGVTFDLVYIQKGYFHKVCNTITDQLEATYLEVPIALDYSVIVPSLKNWKGHLNVGVYGAYWLSGKYKMEGFDESNEDFDFNENEASRFDFGPNVGGRIEYLLNNGTLSLDLRYEMGVLDLQKRVNDNTSNTNRALIIGVSYLKLLGH
jgi:hypothetical protein